MEVLCQLEVVCQVGKVGGVGLEVGQLEVVCQLEVVGQVVAVGLSMMEVQFEAMDLKIWLLQFVGRPRFCLMCDQTKAEGKRLSW